MISNLNPTHGAHLARKWSCVWRPDVGSRLYARGSWQAAAGVGGLAWLQTGLAQTVAMFSYQEVSGNAEVHIPMMDHMGNVRHYYQIKATGPGASASYVTGQVTANLEYDAFGREVRATGTKTPASGQPPGLAPGEPWVDVLPFHFSTKFTDRESGLNYYGYRFYDAVDGRWASRDPIGEGDGPNLYAMVHNNPVNMVDMDGRTGWGPNPNMPPGYNPITGAPMNQPTDPDKPTHDAWTPGEGVAWDPPDCPTTYKTKFIQIARNALMSLILPPIPFKHDIVDDGTHGRQDPDDPSVRHPPFYPEAREGIFSDAPTPNRSTTFEVCRVCYCPTTNMIESIGPCKHYRTSVEPQILNDFPSVLEPSKSFRDVYNNNMQPGWPSLPQSP